MTQTSIHLILRATLLQGPCNRRRHLPRPPTARRVEVRQPTLRAPAFQTSLLSSLRCADRFGRYAHSSIAAVCDQPYFAVDARLAKPLAWQSPVLRHHAGRRPVLHLETRAHTHACSLPLTVHHLAVPLPAACSRKSTMQQTWSTTRLGMPPLATRLTTMAWCRASA